jgi:hypothetical protein
LLLPQISILTASASEHATSGWAFPRERLPSGEDELVTIEGRLSVVEDHHGPFDSVEAAVAWARLRAPVTPRMPVATAHAYSLPTVREIPPVQRPGTFDSTW